jgi:hypothetical protein
MNYPTMLPAECSFRPSVFQRVCLAALSLYIMPVTHIYGEDWQMDMLPVVFVFAIIAVAIAAWFVTSPQD